MEWAFKEWSAIAEFFRLNICTGEVVQSAWVYKQNALSGPYKVHQDCKSGNGSASWRKLFPCQIWLFLQNHFFTLSPSSEVPQDCLCAAGILCRIYHAYFFIYHTCHSWILLALEPEHFVCLLKGLPLIVTNNWYFPGLNFYHFASKSRNFVILIRLWRKSFCWKEPFFLHSFLPLLVYSYQKALLYFSDKNYKRTFY